MKVTLGVTDPQIIGARIRAARRRRQPSRRRVGLCYRCGQVAPVYLNGKHRRHDCFLVPLPMDQAEAAWAEATPRMRGAMKFPDRLDYDEVEIAQSDEQIADYGQEWAPLVFCTVEGCSWQYQAAWHELGDDDFGADWDALHPAHEAADDAR